MNAFKLNLLFVAGLSGFGLSALTAEIRPLEPKTGLEPFHYTNAQEVLPNYVAGAKWGTQTDPIRTMQLPVSPEESRRHLVMPPGFEASLYAAEPDIVKPIVMAWDARGRLWIAETIDYPNELQPQGQGRDRIKICEDTDHDGRADRFTVFADGLSIPTGLCFANGGLIVIESGRTLFLKDTDGDDRADQRRELFSGWGTNDTHATANNLRYGFDNWIWGTVGYSGFNGDVGGKPHRFGMGVFRFKPDGGAMEFVRSSNNNTWGLGLSEEGIVFGSTANNNASWYMAVPNRFYEAVRGWSASRMETIADSQRIYPITSKVRQVDWHHKYTAGAGHALYTARAFPQNFWNRAAFVTEPTGHLIGWFDLQKKGSDFTSTNLGSFLASDDEWCSPIMAEVGPDGALWMIDWYSYIVQHNPTPHGFKTGKGNAYETTLRDKKHGRIYRLAYTAPLAQQDAERQSGTAGGARARTGAPLRLDTASGAQLVSSLYNDNQLWRMHAQRLLVERGQKDVVPALIELVRNTAVDEIGLNPAAIHALWVLHGLGAADQPSTGEAIRVALKHPSAGVRRAAVGVMPRTEPWAELVVSEGLLKDADAQVRLATLLSLAESPAGKSLGEALHAAIRENDNSSDRWIRDACASAGSRHAPAFLRAMLTSRESLPEGGLEVARIVARHYAAPGPDDAVPLLVLLKGASEWAAGALLDGFAVGWPQGRAPTLSAKDRVALEEMMNGLAAASRGNLLLLARKWDVPDLFARHSVAVIESLRSDLTNAAAEDKSRLAAAQSLLRLDDQAATVSAVLDQITLQSTPTLAAGLISALGESRNAGTAGEILARWTRLTPVQRKAAIATLLRRSEWSHALLDEIEQKRILATELGPEHYQQLRTHADRTLGPRATKLADTGKVLSADREEVVNRLIPAAKQPGDVARGKEVFTANCAVCHKFNGIGTEMGPDLTGIGARPREDVLVDILDPNRSVEANYRLWIVTTKGGDTLSGRLDTETQTSIELVDLTGQKHIVQRKELASLDASALSIMPIGFEALPASDLSALLEFLASQEPVNR